MVLWSEYSSKTPMVSQTALISENRPSEICPSENCKSDTPQGSPIYIILVHVLRPTCLQQAPNTVFRVNTLLFIETKGQLC